MTAIAWIVVIAAVVVVLFWQSNRHMARMGAFVEKAIQRYSEDENPVALKYILIAYSTSVGTKRNEIVLRPIYYRRLDIPGQDPTKQDEMFARIAKLEEMLKSKEWGYKESLDLKGELPKDYFSAWRKFDLTIFDRI